MGEFLAWIRVKIGGLFSPKRHSNQLACKDSGAIPEDSANDIWGADNSGRASAESSTRFAGKEGIKSRAQLEAERLLRDEKNEKCYILREDPGLNLNNMKVPNQEVAVALEDLLKQEATFPESVQTKDLWVQAPPGVFKLAREALPSIKIGLVR